MRKQNTKTTVPLDVVPERRTKLPRDTFFRDRSDPEDMRYRTKEAKQKKANKKKKRGIKHHKND